MELTQQATDRATNGAAQAQPGASAVSLTVAASVLGIDKSTISRYLAAHPELNRASGGAPLVDVEEVRAHRVANVNPRLARGTAARMAKAKAEPAGLVLAAMTIAGDGETVTATFRIRGALSSVEIAERLHRAEADEPTLDFTASNSSRT